MPRNFAALFVFKNKYPVLGRILVIVFGSLTGLFTKTTLYLPLVWCLHLYRLNNLIAGW